MNLDDDEIEILKKKEELYEEYLAKQGQSKIQLSPFWVFILGMLAFVLLLLCGGGAYLLLRPSADPTAQPIVIVATRTPDIESEETLTASLPTSVASTIISSEVVQAGKIVFDSPINGKWQVFEVNPDGSGLRQLTSIATGIGDPAISPDGLMVVFVANDAKELQIMNVDGSQIWTVYSTSVEVGWPAWSPDSGSIVFSVRNADGRASLFTANADGTDPKQITDSPSEDLGPAWSPDGEMIAFSSNRSGTWEIHRLTLVNGAIDQLTFTGDPEPQGWPAWSFDGSSITFESRGKENERDVFVMNSDGSQVRNITDSAAYDGAPVWSPDGGAIAFASDRDGSLGIYTMRSDGSQVKKLTPIWAWGPSWSRE